MAFKPNYNQQRAERNRLKQAKKDAKLRELEDARARRKTGQAESGQAESGQAESGQAESGQAESGLPETGHAETGGPDAPAAGTSDGSSDHEPPA
jgi:hypothetical protein